MNLSQNQKKLLEKVRLIQRKFRVYLFRKRIQRRILALRYGKRVFSELVSTQVAYILALNLLIREVKLPTQANKLLSREKIECIFLNMQEIIRANTEFYQVIKAEGSLYEKLHKINESFQLFDCYKYYIIGYQEALVALQKARMQDQFFRALIESAQLNSLNNLTIESYLIKPIQRIAKYSLLMRQMRKKLPIDNQLSQICQKTEERFQLINNELDQRLKQAQRVSRGAQIQDKFLKKKGQQSVRHTFIGQFQVKVLVEKKKIEVTLYIFHDLLLLTRETILDHEKEWARLNLDSLSFVKDLPSQKFTANAIFVQGYDSSLTLQSENNVLKVQLLKSLKQCIKDQQELNIVRVRVAGVEERTSNFFSKYTAYIVTVRLGQQNFQLVTRFREVLQFSRMTIQRFPSLNLKKLCKHYVTAHKAQTIAARKVVIQEILSSILNFSQVIKNPSAILLKLGLPPTFYTAEVSKPSSAHYLHLKQYQFQVILGLNWSCHVFVNKLTKVYEIEDKVSIQLGLQSQKDFKLLLREGSNQTFLKPQEEINKIYNFQKSLIGSMIKRHKIFFFRRFSYQSLERENQLFVGARARLQFQDILETLAKTKYNFTPGEWSRLLGYYCLTKGEQEQLLPELVGRLPARATALKKEKEFIEQIKVIIIRNKGQEQSFILGSAFNLLRKEELFRTSVFKVKLDKLTQKELGVKTNKILLAISPEKIFLYSLELAKLKQETSRSLLRCEREVGEMSLEWQWGRIGIQTVEGYAIASLLMHYGINI